MILKGTHCIFDYSRLSQRYDFVKSAVKYFDRKAPEVFATVGLPIPKECIELCFHPREGAMFAGPNKIEICDNISNNDLGCLIHECVHWTQSPFRQDFRDSHVKLFEGIADYYRIVLSDDHKGDYYNNDKMTLVRDINPNDLYNSGSEFIAYLRRRSGNEQFVKLLNDAIRTGNADCINVLFQDTFSKCFDELLYDYTEQRSKIIDKRPENVNRFDFFTRMS